MTTHQSSGWFSGRTRLITVISIVAVGIAGATAVSANTGILNSSSDSNVGNVAAADLTTPNTQVVDVYLDGQTTASTLPSTGAEGVQQFAVDTAGAVGLTSDATGIRLDSVSPAAGWTWSLSQSSPTQLLVTFTDGTRTLEFTATQNPDGTIAAAVNEPIVTAAPANNGGGSYSGDDDDEHEGGEDDD